MAKWCLLCIGLWLPSVVLGNPTSFSELLQKRAEKWRHRFHASTLSVSVYDTQQHQFFDVAIGSESHQAHKISVATVYPFGSVIKQWLAVTLLQWQDEGLIDLSQTLDDVCQQHHIAVFYPSQWGVITIRQLLNMTSGVPSYWDDEGYQKYLGGHGSRHTYQISADLLAIVKSYPMLFEPGNGWQYSDSNYVLLGLLLERISQQSFSALMHQRFDGLFRQSLCPIQYARDDVLSINKRNALSTCSDSVYRRHAPRIMGTASRYIMATTHDMSLWEASLFEGPLLSVRGRAELHQTVSKINGRKLTHAGQLGYSLAMNRMVLKHHNVVWYYPGTTPGFTTVVMWFPAAHRSFAIALNRSVKVKELFDVVMPDLLRLMNHS